MEIGSGLVVGALALLAVLRKRGAGAGNQPGTNTRLAVDPRLVTVLSSGPVGVNSATLAAVNRDRAVKQAWNTVGTIASTALSIGLAAAGVSVTDVLIGAMQMVATIEFIALGIILVAVAILVILSSIFGQLVEERTRMKFALRTLAGSWNTVNAWEFKTAEAWLKQMKVPYTVTSVDDTRLTGTFYADRQVFTRYYQRYALTNVGLPAIEWQKLQLLVRCACINYLKQVGFYAHYYGINWNVPLGAEAPPPPLPPAPVRTWVDTFRDLVEFKGTDGRTYWRDTITSETFSTPVESVRTIIWNEFPMIGDATALPLVPEGYGDKPVAAPVFFTPSKLAPSYEAGIAAIGNQTLWEQIKLNNHLMAILSTLMMCRLDPREVREIERPAYAKHMWAGLGLRLDRDHVGYDSGQLLFKISYWGFTVIVDVMGVKSGFTRPFRVIGPDGVPTDVSTWGGV